MPLPMVVTALLAALIHILIFCMESLWWSNARVQARFGLSSEQAASNRLFAFNQGFYNLFLALGVCGGLWLVLTGSAPFGLLLVAWNCLSMLGAAIVLLASARQLWRGAVVQGTAPLLFLLFTISHLTA
jgi:putative membrane protein